MAKEKFLIVATRMPDDCFGRFSETENREAIAAGNADPDDPYSWIEASFEIQLIRYREATHICSFTPSAYYVWIQNYFVGIPNEAWNDDGDPDGLEMESGGTYGDYGTYHDEYDSRFICETFTIDTVKELGIRKPGVSRSLSRRSETESDRLETYHDAIWKLAEETAADMNCNGVAGAAPILDVVEFRKWEREQSAARRRQNRPFESTQLGNYGVAQ